MSPDLGLAGLVANVVAAPLGEIVALPLCLSHPLTAPLPVLEKVWRWSLPSAPGGARGRTPERLGHSGQGCRFLNPARGTSFCSIGAVGIRLAHGAHRVGRRAIWLHALAIGLVRRARGTGAGSPREALRLTAIDVEQGDSTLVDLPDGGLLLVDAGGFVGSPVDPGRAVIRPLPGASGDRIDIAVLSHPHPDHFGGLSPRHGRGRRILGLGSR